MLEDLKLPFCSFLYWCFWFHFFSFVYILLTPVLYSLLFLDIRESEYAAWTLVNGYALNHATIATHCLESDIRSINRFNKFVEDNGFKLNSEGGILKGLLLISAPSRLYLVVSGFLYITFIVLCSISHWTLNIYLLGCTTDNCISGTWSLISSAVWPCWRQIFFFSGNK